MDSIKTEKIQFGYYDKLILDDLTFHFGKGSLFGIVGPNGCGKSTLLNLLGGILRTKFGKVVINDTDIKTLSYKEIAQKIAYVQQQKAPLEFNFSVEEVIMMGRYAYIERLTGESEEDKKIVLETMTKLNLIPVKDRPFSQLSGGEQQKVIIARAIVQQAKILLLDEPTSHLDINYQLEFMELFKKFVQQGIIVIIVLHDLNLAAQYCDKVILIKNGKIEAFGTVEDTFTRQNIRTVYGIDTMIRRNPITNTLFITPLRQHDYPEHPELQNIKIHVIVGGGNATQLLPLIKYFDISVGVVNVLDGDHDLATELGYELISEAPFSPISETSTQLLITKLNRVDCVILTNVPFGNANIKNLEVLQQFSKPIYILEQTPIESRDFTGGKATQLYNSLLTKKNVIKYSSIHDLLNKLNTFG
jgi:iron complex transport system ATP-binding protein